METNTEGAEVPENITDYKNLFDLWLATKKQNAALKAALAELIRITSRMENIISVDEHYKSALDRAKKLL